MSSVLRQINALLVIVFIVVAYVAGAFFTVGLWLIGLVASVNWIFGIGY